MSTLGNSGYFKTNMQYNKQFEPLIIFTDAGKSDFADQTGKSESSYKSQSQLGQLEYVRYCY